MKKIIVVLLFFITSNVYADDTMAPVFDRVDDLLTRVDSGISLNSFAETYAGMKIEYKKATTGDSRIYNPLLDDRMKEVFIMLDDYSKAWKQQEVEGYKYMPSNAPMISRYDVQTCRIYANYSTLYEIPCIKKILMDALRPKVEKAKSAHFNGW